MRQTCPLPKGVSHEPGDEGPGEADETVQERAVDCHGNRRSRSAGGSNPVPTALIGGCHAERYWQGNGWSDSSIPAGGDADAFLKPACDDVPLGIPHEVRHVRHRHWCRCLARKEVGYVDLSNP